MTKFRVEALIDANTPAECEPHIGEIVNAVEVHVAPGRDGSGGCRCTFVPVGNLQGSVFPCNKGVDCSWPACSLDCEGRGV